MAGVDLEKLPHPIVRLLAQAVLAEDLRLRQEVVLPAGARDLRRQHLVGGALELLQIQDGRVGAGAATTGISRAGSGSKLQSIS